MASVQFNYSGNMLSPVVVYGTVMNATSTNINIVGNSGINYWQANYYGSGFTYSGYEVTGGTLQSYTHSVNGVLSYRVFDVSVPAASAARYIQSGDLYGLEQIVLSGKDWIGGSNYSDTLAGFADNDGIVGAGGNDYIDGGTGIDTAFYAGQLSSYSITRPTLSRVNVIDSISGRDGTDTLTSVERLKFSDTSLALDIGRFENAGEIYRLYEAAFDRAPKPVGEGYWLNKLDNGETLVQIADEFLLTPEFKSIYGESPSNTLYVTTLFEHVLGRAPKQAGLDYYTGWLENGKSKAEVLVDISESLENVANVATLIANGIQYQAAG